MFDFALVDKSAESYLRLCVVEIVEAHISLKRVRNVVTEQVDTFHCFVDLRSLMPHINLRHAWIVEKKEKHGEWS